MGSAVASRPSVLFLLCRYELTGCLFRTVRAFKWPERRRTALHSQGCDWLEIQRLLPSASRAQIDMES